MDDRTISLKVVLDAADSIIKRDMSGNNDVVKAMTAWKAFIRELPSATDTNIGGMGNIGFIYNMDFNKMKKKNKLKRKATNSLKQVVYMAIWNKEVPKKCKKVKCYEN